ncbi:MAG: 1-phosphofructokinase family hexose kinase, partial [Candidatus Omnitrophica bacterium]|nr:1-phosphofructokinase family hexose kinase [Candidatus Omnitrophota bacterium]
MKTIICITLNPAIDKSSSVEYVTAERKLYCQRPQFEPGGGGVNVSRAIQKLGGTSTLFYPQGGLSGQLLDNLLKEEGINHQSFPINGVIRENLIILETSTGYQFRFGMPGPEIHEKEWRGCLDEISRIKPKADYIVASG